MNIVQLPFQLKTRPARPAMLIGIYLGLALLTWAVFGQAVGHQFVRYDDQNYVYENPRITAGLTSAGFVAAFTRCHAQNWHPLTTVSHMLDCQLWGLNPAGHHLVNVLLHATAALLLFSAMNAMTGAIWRSAFVAAVFAIHPLRAESVAWVAERKDVLSGVLFMLTLIAYVRYVRDQRLSRYLVVVACFGLALMSKPTVVTLPVLLLALDYWPLNRLPGNELRQKNHLCLPLPHRFLALLRQRVILEKVLLVVLSLGLCLVTFFAQRQTVAYSHAGSLTGRIGNALVSYVTYLGQMIWPTRLAVFYPDTADRVSALTVGLSALLLSAITVYVVWARRTRPYLVVGWCWYIVSLLPVIGLVQVGLQGHADRYTYLAQIGLYIAVGWSIADLPAFTSAAWRRALGIGAVAVVIVLACLASIQTSTWNDTESLWTHALRVTDENDVAHNNVAELLMQRGKFEEAIGHYEAALNAGSRRETHNHLSPAIVENSLGNAFGRLGKVDAAIVHYRKALDLRPDFVDARTNLSAMLVRKGEVPEAISEFQKVVATPPEDAVSHQRLATMLARVNRTGEAVSHYREALRLDPDSLDALNRLAWILATTVDPAIRNGSEALFLAERADRLTKHKDPVVLRILAASNAAAGRVDQAVATAERALSLAGRDAALASSLESEISLYRKAAVQIVSSRRNNSAPKPH